MNRACMQSRSAAVLVASLLGGLGTLAFEGEAEAAVAYVRSNTGAPWGQTTNEQAMDMAFGVGGWDDLRFETVAPGTLFSPTYSFIYIDGSDSTAIELATFLMANQAALEAWVSSGGGLFLNSAPNEGGNMMWGFGGITLTNGDFPVDPGMAVDPMHPIWTGPFLPTSPAAFTGGAYAHASVSGPGLAPLIIDSNGGNPNLGELPFGTGGAIFGGLTTSNFWDPNPEALNLRANIIAYLAGGGPTDSDMDGIVDAADNCPMMANPMQEDGDMDGVGDICDPCPMSMVNDADMDMTCDDVDNCPGLANPGQADDDMDGLGNACDECPADPDDDIDGDTICGDVDNCPDTVNVNQADSDNDGIGDLCDDCVDDPDNDADMDGVCAADDNCPDDANADQADADGDGIGDACDDPGGADSTGGDPDTGDGSMGGGTDTLDPDTGGDPDTGDGSTGGIDITAGGSGDDGGATGCGCTTNDSEPRGWWMLALLGVVLRRRRRAA